MNTSLKPLDTITPQVRTESLPPVDPELTPEEEQAVASVDAFSAGTLAPFDVAPVGEAPLSVSQLEGIAQTLTSVSDRQITVEDVRKSFNEGVFGTTVDEAYKTMLAASGARKKVEMLNLLNRGDLTVQQRLDLVREFDASQRGPDMNAVERQSLSMLNSQENGGYSPEDEAAFADSLSLVANMPVLAQPTAEVPALSPKELQRSFTELLNLAVIDADERSKFSTVKGAASFLPNLIPFFSTVPTVKVLKEMTRALDVDVGMSTTGAAFMPGTAIRLMREKIETLPLEQKVKAFGAVARVLKGNKAIFPTQNAHMQSYLIQSLFYKDIHGTDYIKEASTEENKAFIHARVQAERFGRLAANEQNPAKRSEYGKQKVEWERKAINIDQNASGRLWHEYDRTSLGQWLDDLAILDWMVVMPLLRSTVKGGQKALSGTERRALRVAPNATTDKYIKALQDPRARKKLTDLLGEDIAETMLPAATRNAVEEGVEGMGEMLERAERLRMEINRTLKEGSNVTAQSQHEYAQELKQIFGDLEPRVAMMHTTKSAFDITEDGVEVVARYGATPTKAFGQYDAAKRALDKMPAEGRIVELTDKGFVPVSETKRLGRYFIEVTDKRTYDSSRSAWESALFDRGQVRAPWFLPANSSIGGKASKLWNWFYSSSDMFGPKIFNRITSDVMRAAVVQKLHTGFTRTMLSLPRNEQSVVSALLKQGEEIPTATGKGTVFTTEQIRTMYPKISDRAIVGYYEARALADNMWELANSQKRAEYFREGVKSIHSSTGHVGYGRVLNTSDEAVEDIKSAQGFKTLHVFYPETGQFAALHRAEIDQLYSQGAHLARMDELVQGKGFAEATHVVVKADSNMVRELPRDVLPKINGYYPHIYQGNYIVYGVSKAGNKVAVSTARSISDAHREVARISGVMQKMKARGKDAPFEAVDYQFDRALRDPMVYKDDVGGPVFGAQQKVYGTRVGYGLRNASKQYGDHMVDPIEALLRGMELVSHSVTKGNLIKNMEARLYNTLRLVEKETGQKIIKDPRKLVKTPDDINYVHSASKDIQKAVAYMQQIDMVRHIPDAVETMISNMLTGSAELFYRLSKKLPLPGLEKLEGALATRAAKGLDPMRLLTEMAHRVYIAGNPIQQFALQLSQASLVLGIAPRDLPRALSAAVPMHMLVNSRIMLNSGDTAFTSAYNKLLPVAARAVGMKPETLDKMVGVLERSGLVDTVSVHSQIRMAARAQATTRMMASAQAANNPTLLRNSMEALRKLDDATFGNLSKYGFEAGEQMNRILTFLSLYRRDVRKGIANLDQPAYIQKLVGEVNTLVGSMLRETNMGYQRGWLKAAFQFVAFQHKMASMMLFSKNLSFQQKLGISLSQFLLFGSRGAAHLDAAHRAFENVVNKAEASNPEEKNQMVEAYWHPTTQSAIDGLVFDMGVNSLIRAVGGADEPGFAWNRRLAPGGGSEMLVDTLVELRNNPVEKVFGLSGKHGSKLVKFFDKMRRYMLADAKNMDDVPAEERWKALGKEGLTLAFSGYDKYLQASVMKGMGGPVTATGNVSMSANTQLERTLAAGLGVLAEDRQAFFDATDKYYFDVRNDPERHKLAMDAIADQMYRDLVTEMIKLKGEAATPEVYEDMQTRLLQNKAMMLSFLTPHEAEVVSELIGNRIAEAIKNRNSGVSAEAAFIADLTQDLRDGRLGDKESLEWEAYLRRTPLYERYPQMTGEFREARRHMLTYDDEEEE